MILPCALKGFELQNFLVATQMFMYTGFELMKALPVIIFEFNLSMFKAFMSIFTYHLFSLPAKAFHNEVVMIIGSDSTLGHEFALQVIDAKGTVICVDTDKKKGDSFVKGLNEMYDTDKAHFYECDVKSRENLNEVVGSITKKVGDVSVLLNCSSTSIVSTYFDAYSTLLPIMKGNKKGTLVFIRTTESGETRDAIASLHEGITKNLKDTRYVTTLIANIYPRISEHGEKNQVFGNVKPDVVASVILEGVAKKRGVVFIPQHMIYFSLFFRFVPSQLVNLIETFLFGV